MTLPRLSLFLAVGLAVVALGASSAEAQDASRSRGSVKVRPRFFNPFDVGGGRFTLSPFGFFTVGVPSAAPAPLDPAPAGAPTPQSADSGDSLAVGAGGVRPPFRPPVRSPFRPPPRPPF